MSTRWLARCMLGILVGSLASGAALRGETPQATAPSPLVLEVLRKTPLVDGHNDLPWEIRSQFKGQLDSLDLEDTRSLEEPLQTDLARLRAGRVGAQFWSVYVPVEESGANAIRAVLEQIDLVKRLASRYPETLGLATTAADIERIHRAGRVASLIGVEGGHCVDNSLAVLRQLYACGARYMTLAHSKNTEWVDSATDTPRHGGLAPFGEEIVREMNRIGMLVDLSHVSAEAMHDVLDVSRSPVVFSHSSARALCDFPRNVPDDVLQRMPANGGLVMVTFAPSFVSPEVLAYETERKGEEARLRALHPSDSLSVVQGMRTWVDSRKAPRATLAQVADHIDHIRRVAGIDHVGIGSDFDGISKTPIGLEDVSCFPALLDELARRGYDAEALGKVAGGNLLRVLREAERFAADWRRTGMPADAVRR